MNEIGIENGPILRYGSYVLKRLHSIVTLLLVATLLNLFGGVSHEIAHSMETAAHADTITHLDHSDQMNASPDSSSDPQHLADHHQHCAASANCCALLAGANLAFYAQPVETKSPLSVNKLLSSHLMGIIRPPSA